MSYANSSKTPKVGDIIKATNTSKTEYKVVKVNMVDSPLTVDLVYKINVKQVGLSWDSSTYTPNSKECYLVRQCEQLEMFLEV